MKELCGLLLAVAVVCSTGCSSGKKNAKASLGEPQPDTRVTILDNANWQMLSESDIDSDYVVETDAGKVQGFQQQAGVVRFAAIPFAAPPTAALRFRPPQAIAPWQGILDSREFGPSCIQPGGGDLTVQSEDCLWLTVNTPALDAAKRPVVVWIHGGGFSEGGNREAVYDAANVVRRGELVFVNLQYRLGTLGWLDFAHLAGEDRGTEMSNGSLDQLMGLKWVARNIAKFGGDPNNITLMGESAGSISVGALLRSDAAAPYFQRAIMQSFVHEPLTDLWSRKQVSDLYRQVANADSLAALQQLPAGQLRALQQRFAGALEKQHYFESAAYAPTTLTEADIVRAAARGKPVFHGITRSEYHYFAGMDPAQYRGFAEGLLQLEGLSVSQIARLVERLGRETPQRATTDLYVDVLTNLYTYYPHHRFSQLYGQSAPVYHYLFDLPLPDSPGTGAIHGQDLPYTFANLAAPGWQWAVDKNRQLAQRVAFELQDAVIAFARTGTPAHGGLPDWPSFQSLPGSMRFGEESELMDNHAPWIQSLWDFFDAMKAQ